MEVFDEYIVSSHKDDDSKKYVIEVRLATSNKLIDYKTCGFKPFKINESSIFRKERCVIFNGGQLVKLDDDNKLIIHGGYNACLPRFKIVVDIDETPCGGIYRLKPLDNLHEELEAISFVNPCFIDKYIVEMDYLIGRCNVRRIDGMDQAGEFLQMPRLRWNHLLIDEKYYEWGYTFNIADKYLVLTFNIDDDLVNELKQDSNLTIDNVLVLKNDNNRLSCFIRIVDITTLKIVHNYLLHHNLDYLRILKSGWLVNWNSEPVLEIMKTDYQVTSSAWLPPSTKTCKAVQNIILECVPSLPLTLVDLIICYVRGNPT